VSVLVIVVEGAEHWAVLGKANVCVGIPWQFAAAYMLVVTMPPEQV